MRPEIELPGARSQPGDGTDEGPTGPAGPLVRAARPVLEQVGRELDGAPALLLLGDTSASVVDIRFVDRAVRREMTDLGITVGTRADEENLGINALGTPVVTGRGVLVRGHEHSVSAFSPFVCYGHPVVHPVTRRLEGVFSISCRTRDEHPLLRPLARRVVRDIEDRLRIDADHAQQGLFAAFQTAARRRGHAVVVIGQGLVLSTPSALDLLHPTDQTIIRAWSETLRSVDEATLWLTLVSGRTVRLDCARLKEGDGVRIHIVPEQDAPRRRAGRAPGAARPLLIVGESGTGRTTEARRAAGPDATMLDAADVDRLGEQAWVGEAKTLLDSDGPAVVVENLDHLSEHLVTLLARFLRGTRRDVVLTTLPGEHLETTHAPLVSVYAARRDLVPLRQRRHDIAPLAQRMLADIAGPGRIRLTSDTARILAEQPWPGNLTELRGVVRSLADVRSAGDIIPSDLPSSHCRTPPPTSPFRQAEREIILAAIKAAGGNKLRAARALGVSRSTLYNKMRALHIH
ncbi:sigma-54-dependent Fis family transcriptional regulator [Embleya sp. MST-111070]|uniref:sigma-54-dependent Fis family transcriptional regulator n=1 Tax=Embleya sp. MST-111070 TaxID=3398231 RepID=UPI003F7329FA